MTSSARSAMRKASSCTGRVSGTTTSRTTRAPSWRRSKLRARSRSRLRRTAASERMRLSYSSPASAWVMVRRPERRRGSSRFLAPPPAGRGCLPRLALPRRSSSSVEGRAGALFSPAGRSGAAREAACSCWRRWMARTAASAEARLRTTSGPRAARPGSAGSEAASASVSGPASETTFFSRASLATRSASCKARRCASWARAVSTARARACCSRAERPPVAAAAPAGAAPAEAAGAAGGGEAGAAEAPAEAPAERRAAAGAAGAAGAAPLGLALAVLRAARRLTSTWTVFVRRWLKLWVICPCSRVLAESLGRFLRSGAEAGASVFWVSPSATGPLLNAKTGCCVHRRRGSRRRGRRGLQPRLLREPREP